MAHYYRNDLRKQPSDGLDENIMQARPCKEVMPRYRISEDSFFFENLFSLLDLDGEIATNAWNLIKKLTTNPHLYKGILRLDKDPQFQWEKVFDSSNICKMLYSLQIVESLLEKDHKDDDKLVTEDEETLLKNNWIERFMKIGGF